MTHIRLQDELSLEDATRLAVLLASASPVDGPVTVDFSEADVTEPRATAVLVSALREAASKRSEVRILEPPQVVAHGLYRVGALGSTSKIRLISPREEIGVSS